MGRIARSHRLRRRRSRWRSVPGGNGKLPQINIVILRDSFQTLFPNRTQGLGRDAKSNEAIASLPPKFVCLQIDTLNTMSVLIGFGDGHSLAVFTFAGQVAFALAHSKKVLTRNLF